MGSIVISATMSLDGYIAHADDSVDPLFDWYSGGDVAIAGGDPERVFHTSRTSADWIERYWSRIGAAVIGRTLFDHTDGWGGRPAAGDHVVVVTHRALPQDWRARFPDAPFTVAGDLTAAVTSAKELAGDRDVTVTAGNLAGQALAAGLVDEIDVGLVPVVLGSGKRFFGDYDAGPALLADPCDVAVGERVTHLRYRVAA